jgi:ribosomal protein S18 acetylase RimI-like enzyme
VKAGFVLLLNFNTGIVIFPVWILFFNSEVRLNIEIKEARIPEESAALTEMDKVIFSGGGFSEEEWEEHEAFWLIVDGRKVGSVAFKLNGVSGETSSEPYHPAPGCAYIAGTEILPEFQGIGLGSILKAWEIAYARAQGFGRIETNARMSNLRSINLNLKHGFKVVRVKPGYYGNPTENALVLELRLDKSRS